MKKMELMKLVCTVMRMSITTAIIKKRGVYSFLKKLKIELI